MTSTLVKASLTPCTDEQIANLEKLCQQLENGGKTLFLRTEHHLHAGVYSRTIYVPKGVMAVGVTIKVPTQFIASGDFTLTDGGTSKRFKGHHVFDGASRRRAAVFAHEDSAFTMLFATTAQTVEEAEEEFTDEADRLATRKEKLLCQGTQSRQP